MLKEATEYREKPPYSSKLPVCPHCKTISYRIKPYIDYSILDTEDNCEISCRECGKKFIGKIPNSSLWLPKSAS